MVSDGKVAEHRIYRVLLIQNNGSGVELFNEISDPKHFARDFKLLPYRMKGFNGRLRATDAVKVPAVKAGEVLKCT